MEKKGDILNQLAIITDLMEKLNLESKLKTILFDLEKPELDRVYAIISGKSNIKTDPVKNEFSITIGEANIIFSTNNV